VPSGCLTVLVLFAIFVFSMVILVFGAMKSSDVYKTALRRAQVDPRVRHALGSHIHAGMFLSGSTNVTGSSGKADLSIPISGSKGKGTIYVVATKSEGEWHYSKLTVKTADGDAIDLTQTSDSEDESDSEDDTT
jgi:hypothetical protein